MQHLSNPEQLGELALSSTVLERISEELVARPFGTLELAAEFWREHPTQLTLVESGDSLDLVLREFPQLSSVLECPEFVIPLADGWYLALVITSDQGEGTYLVFSLDTDQRLDQLAQQST